MLFQSSKINLKLFKLVFAFLLSIISFLTLRPIDQVCATSTDRILNAKTVGISQIVDHPALNMTAAGIRDTLKQAGDIQILFENAQGNIATSAQIAQKFIGQNVDCIIAIGTSPAQTALKAVKNTSIPVVFATVSDPVGAELVHNLEAPEGQITGSSNFTPLKPIFDLIKNIVPQLQSLGMIYNPGEANGTAMVQKVIDTAKDENVRVITSPAASSRDVALATQALIDQHVDVLFISNDNTALSAFQTIVKIASESRIPVFVSDVDMVEQGAIAALGPNQYDVGVQAGQLVLKILRGTAVKDAPVTFPQQSELYLNHSQAKKIGIQLSFDLIKKAVKVF